LNNYLNVVLTFQEKKKNNFEVVFSFTIFLLYFVQFPYPADTGHYNHVSVLTSQQRPKNVVLTSCAPVGGLLIIVDKFLKEMRYDKI